LCRSPQFAAADEQNHLHRRQVTRLGGGAIPRHVAAGQTVSLLVHGVLPVGNGRLKWTPDRGRTRAGWDFDVEVD